MFGSNSWSGPNGQHRIFFPNGPQPPPRPPSILTQQFPFTNPNAFNLAAANSNNNPLWLNPPPKPPSIFTGFTDVKKTAKRLGYLAATPWKIQSKAKTVDFVERATTRPDQIDEKEYKVLENKVKAAMTQLQKEEAKDIHDFTKQNLLLTHPSTHSPIPERISPHGLRPKEFCAYPSRKRNFDLVQQSQEYNQRRYQKYPHDTGEYIVQTSTKLIRNRTILKPAQNNMKLSRAEEVDTSVDSEKTTPEPEITIQLQDSSQNSDDNDSPNGVLVVCETSKTPERAPRPHDRSPEKTARSSSHSSTLPHRGQMSLRNIKGQKITGDSRECFNHLTSTCKAGIFCRFEHSGSAAHQRIKVCQRLLRGLCRPDNGHCHCEHIALLPHQYPLCVFFARGDCSMGDKCVLLHVKYSNAAKHCPEFIRGTCFAGNKCDYAHSYPYGTTKEKGTLEEIPAPPTNDQNASTFKWIE